MNAGTGRTRWAAVALSALLAAVVFVGSPAGAADSTVEKELDLQPTQVFTRTNITLKEGDQVEISAEGTIHFGGGKIAELEPPGIPWGEECRSVARGLALTTPWPAPGLSCWSLIGKSERNGKPFEIGNGTSFTATKPGLIILGVNDNFVNDNTGTWQITVKVTPKGAVPAGSDKKSSNTILFVLVGALLLAFIILFIVVARRRRGNEPPPDDDPSAIVPSPVAPVGAALGAEFIAEAVEPEAAIAAAPIGAAPLPESIDVNIFEVEFSNGLTLRVGYNHFPQGVDVRWRVTQNRLPAAVGTFRTQGGGSTNHYETITLGVKLEGRDAQPDGADVQFDWTINDVPFRYSVRRDPNC